MRVPGWLCLWSVVAALAGLLLTPGWAKADEQPEERFAFSGHYALDANNSGTSRATPHNIYIKLFRDRWVTTLYIPWPYAESLSSDTITRVLDTARGQVSASAYLKGTFGELDETATASVERFDYQGDLIVFECSKLAPCTLKPGDGYIELIQPGMINEHIVRYEHVSGS